MWRSFFFSDIIANRLNWLIQGMADAGHKLRFPVIAHIISTIMAMFLLSNSGKMVNIAKVSNTQAAAVGKFFNESPWDDAMMTSLLQQKVIELIYNKARETGKPIYCSIDDTFSSVTPPSRQAGDPIEGTYWIYSHLKKGQDFGHQIFSVMLDCAGLKLNLANILYDKASEEAKPEGERKSKIDIACDIAAMLPEAPTRSYVSFDSWYTCERIIKAFAQKGYRTLAGLKLNRVIYPDGINSIQIKNFAPSISRKAARTVTVGNRKFKVYRYRGKLKDLEDVIVLITWPVNAFGIPSAVRAFISTDTRLSMQQILEMYSNRWGIEVYFRSSKNQLGLNRYQIRSLRGIKRFWLMVSLAYYIAATAPGCDSFHAGRRYYAQKLGQELATKIYQCGRNGEDLAQVLEDLSGCCSVLGEVLLSA